MQIQISVYVLILIFASVVSFTLAAYSNLRKTVPAARPFGILCVGIAFFTLMYMFEVISIPLHSKIQFFNLKYIGVALITVGFLWFTLEYTGKRIKYLFRWMAGFMMLQLLALIGLWTNPLHEWFYSLPHLGVFHNFIVFAFIPRAGYYIYLIFPILLAIICMTALIEYFFHTSFHRRQQVTILLAGASIPLLTGLYLVFGGSPDQKIWMTSLSFAIGVPILSVGVFRYRMLDVVPEVRTLILDAMDDAVIVINRDLRVLDINPAAEKFLNTGLNDAIGARLDTLFPEWEQLGLKHEREERIETEIELVRQNNRCVFRVSSWLMTTWWGSSAGRLILLRDITEERQMETNLRQAKEAAEQAANAKTLFLANMSHEIRTPLNAVLGMTQLLLNTRLSPEQVEFTRTIHTSGSTLLNVINEILDYSKIEAGRVHLEMQSFELTTCLEESLDVIAPQASARGLNLTYWLEDEVPAVVCGDAGRIRQVLVNLLANAVKFTEKGEVNLRVESSPAQNDLTQLHFMVMDTGIGIPPEKLPQLFEIFSQIDPSLSHRYGGTGLGLAICRHLVEQMGGRIWAESEPGSGSVFHFTLPLKAESAPRHHPILNGKTLLVMTANEFTARMVRQYARRYGMVVETSTNREEATAKLQHAEGLDAAILDVSWNDTQSSTIPQEVWENLPDSGIPLLLLIPFGTQLSELERVRFSGVIHAPINAAQLTTVLENLLANGEKTLRGAARRKRNAPVDAHFASLYPLQILVADDNQLNLKVVVMFLEQLGYHPLRATSGEEVLEILRQQAVDLLLLDIQMPNMDGLETSRRIHALPPELQPAVIVALTAYSFEHMRQNCLEAGMDDCLNKPVTIEQLRKTIEAAARKLGRQTEVKNAPIRQPSGYSTVLDELDEDREEVARLFLEEIARNLVRLKDAWQKGEPEQVGEIAHALKSGCAYLGANEAARLCLLVEQNALDGRLPEATMLSQIRTQLKRQFPTAWYLLTDTARR